MAGRAAAIGFGRGKLPVHADNKDRDRGWTVELRIPWRSLEPLATDSHIPELFTRVRFSTEPARRP
jgi:hypothetical protein